MTIAYWCVLTIILSPFILSVLSRQGVAKHDYVGDPRAFNEGLGGWRRRAHLAQLNGFEAVPGFAAAVIIAHQVGAPQNRIDWLALIYVGLRAIHAAFYVGDKPSLRSFSWQLSMLCVVGLFVVAAL